MHVIYLRQKAILMANNTLHELSNLDDDGYDEFIDLLNGGHGEDIGVLQRKIIGNAFISALQISISDKYSLIFIGGIDQQLRVGNI